MVLGKAVDRLYDWAASGRKDLPPQDYLEGNFAPVVKEVHSTALEVEGTLPVGLNGAFLRTGPNPLLKPVAGYHWFDGDGMIHAVRIQDGKALSYANHFVETARLKAEKKAGKPLYPKMGDLYGAKALLLLFLANLKRKLGVYSTAQGEGTANTALVFHAQRILSLNEGDLPYALRMLCNGVVETLGRLVVKGAKGDAYPGPFTAHPKLDPVTGELFFFGYSFDTKPYVRAGLMDPQGAMVKQWAVDTPFPSMMHDCALTPTYAVFLHFPLTVDGKKMIRENTLPLSFNDTLPARVGLLRRDTPGCGANLLDPATKPAAVQWFDIPSCFVFHVANAWEDEQGRVHVVVCQFRRFEFNGASAGEVKPPPEDQKQSLYEYTLDPSTGSATVRQLGKLHIDFPVVNPARATRYTRWVWGATLNYNPRTVDIYGIAKFDLKLAEEGKDTQAGLIQFPKGCYGGEAVFVPKPADTSNGDAAAVDSDAGWLLVYVHDTNTERSALHVYDAQTMDPTPLARIFTTQRVPYGFHGTWVSQEQLAAQKTSL